MIPSQRKPDQSRRITTTPQPVPVHITNRNQVQHDIGERTDPKRSFLTSPTTRKTLIVGDSLFKEISPKGLENGVRICKKNGAKIKDIWDEVAVYDLKSFQNIIVCVGGNDSLSGTDAHMFEKKYDELVGGIRTANNDCTIYLCKVVPRGDVDVTRINASIENVANNWRMQHVKIVASTNEMFFGPNGLPCGCYYDTDGIHMSHSGTKQLIHAINRHVLVAHDSEVNSRVGVTDGDQVQDITRVVILVQCSMVEGTETLDLTLSPIGRIQILTYLIWGFLGAAIFDCIIRSCDLFYWFIRTCLGPTVVPATITSLELFCVLTMCYFFR